MALGLFFCLVLAFPSSIIASLNIGLIGLGRTIYEPVCCFACVSTLWTLQLSCGPEYPYGCHAYNAPYLSSLAYCLQQHCSVDGVGTSDIEQFWFAVAGDGQPVSSYKDNLPSSPPTVLLAYDATFLNATSVVNETYYQDTRRSLTTSEYEEGRHALYGTIILVSVIGFCFCLGLQRLKERYLSHLITLPRPIGTFLSKYMLLPALVGSRHLQSLPWSLGYVPSRFLSFLILIYIGLNVLFSLISYPIFDRDPWYVSPTSQHLVYSGNRFGVLCFANIALAIMFSGRNTLLAAITGCSRTDLITFHRWVARVATVQAIAHAATYWTNLGPPGSELMTPTSGIYRINSGGAYWNWGIAAVLVMGSLTFVFSTLPIRVRWYETFLVIHIGCAISILISLWNHVGLQFFQLKGYEVWLYIAFAFWGFDRFARAVRIVALNWRLVTRGGDKASIELLPGGEFVKVTVWPSVSWQFTAGQHCYLYFPTLGNPFQSHPFTIASWNYGRKENSAVLPPPITTPAHHEKASDLHYPDSLTIQLSSPSLPSERSPALEKCAPIHPSPRPSITFLIQPSHGLTQHLHRHLISKSSTSSLTIPLLIEGPYGASPPCVYTANRIVVIAGGIGITAILGYLNLYLSTSSGPQRRKMRAGEFKFFWSARSPSLIAAVRSQLPSAESLRDSGVEISIVCTATEERLDLKALVKKELDRQDTTDVAGRDVVFITCGPGTMADAVRAAAVQGLKIGGSERGRVDVLEEAFCW